MPRNKRRSKDEMRVYMRDYNRGWRSRHPDKVKDRNLKSKYGISLEQFKEILKEQGGTCAICHEPQMEACRWNDRLRYLCVDHDHVTGNIRGLICRSCNVAIARLRDDPMLAYAAFRYLLKTRRAGSKLGVIPQRSLLREKKMFRDGLASSIG